MTTMLTVPEAAKRVRVGRDFLYEEVRAGRLRHMRVGRRILVREEDLATWVEQRLSPEVNMVTTFDGRRLAV